MATFDSGRCTARGCGRKVRDGDGMQIQRADGDLDRLCWGCWLAVCASPDAGSSREASPAEAARDDMVGLEQAALWPTTATTAG